MFSNKMFGLIFSLFLLIGQSCSSDSGGDDIDDGNGNGETPEVVMPTNLTVDIQIQGATESTPNGDGTGEVKFVATANDAVKYGFRLGTGAEIESTTGTIDFTFSQPGTNDYTIYVYAYSRTGHDINISKSLKVYVNDTYQLVWADEFDQDGSPDPNKWKYNIGNGNNGWGNNESQYYTDRLDNAKVEDGVLKIIAKKEPLNGFEYTSARMLTQDKYEFTYGKVEIRAKLPEGGGTWPAFWMLGANIDEVGWPKCGEIDIMEHTGNNMNKVQSAIHSPSSYGNTSNLGSQTVENVAEEFHIYTVEWTETELIFSVDDNVHYTYSPSAFNDDTWPFYKDAFFIMNIAMGGTLGGTIDPNFSEAIMTIDYVRIYQK